MMSIRSLADFNRSSLGGDSDWLIPPPSPPRPQTPGRHDERGMGTFNWPPARTSTWPHAGTFSWDGQNASLMVNTSGDGDRRSAIVKAMVFAVRGVRNNDATNEETR